MKNITITEQQIKAAEDMLEERFCIAMKTDENMGNKDGMTFLPNNADYLYYKGCIDILSCFGLSVQKSKRQGKSVHLIY